MSDNIETTIANSDEKNSQGIFDEQFEAVTNQFVEALVGIDIGAHLIIAEDPKTKQPIVHCNGSTYTLLKMLAKVKQKLADDLARELDL